MSDVETLSRQGSGIPFDTERLLCPLCTVLATSSNRVPLCSRCRTLVDSGKCLGPLPPFLIPRATTRAECWGCSYVPSTDETRTPKFCQRHVEHARARFEASRPRLEYDQASEHRPLNVRIRSPIQSIWVT